MAIEDKLDAEIKDSAQFRGEVREYMRQTTGYIKAVSDNQKQTAKDLKEHSENENAHGIGVREKGADKWVAWVGLFVAISVAAIDFITKHK